MASIKQRKSKGKAECLSVIGEGLSYGYEVRKMNVRYHRAQRPHLVRPLRAIRKVYEQALQAWSRSFVDGQPQRPFPHAEDDLYRTATAAAKRGDGQFLVRLAGTV